MVQHRSRVRSGGRLWGRRRVDAGVSLQELAAASGVSKGLISLMETGRMIPTSEEYDAIIVALDELAAGKDGSSCQTETQGSGGR